MNATDALTGQVIDLENLTEETETALGMEIARVLQLKEARDDKGKRYPLARYETTHGRKTALGLARTVLGLAYKSQQNQTA